MRYSTTAKLQLRDKAFAVNEVSYEPDDNKAFFTFTMLHALPVINGNKMAFSEKTLERSFQTANFNLINHEHIAEGNDGISLWNGSEVIGAMIDAGLVRDDNGVLTMQVVGVLWKRFGKAREIIADIATGGKEWKISMEALYNLKEAGFMVGDNFIGIDETPKDLFKAFDSKMDTYNGQAYAFMLGGTGEAGDHSEPNVNFFGSALTLTPADSDADVLSMVASKDQPLENLEEAWTFAKASQQRIIIASDGTPESTILVIDGTKIDDLSNVEFMSWPGYDDKVMVNWSVNPDKQEGVTRFQSFAFTGSLTNNIEEATMTIKEKLEGLPTEISDAVKAALEGLELPEGVDIDALISEKVDSAVAQFEGWVSPEEQENAIEAGITARIEANEARASKDAERFASLDEAELPLTDERKSAISAFELDDDEGFSAWLDGEKSAVAEMLNELEEDGVPVTEEIKGEIASLSGNKNPAFKAMKTAFASVKAVAPNFFADMSGDDDSHRESPNDSNLSGLM